MVREGPEVGLKAECASVVAPRWHLPQEGKEDLTYP
jgi:hypothetical protein